MKYVKCVTLGGDCGSSDGGLCAVGSPGRGGTVPGMECPHDGKLMGSPAPDLADHRETPAQAQNTSLALLPTPGVGLLTSFLVGRHCATKLSPQPALVPCGAADTSVGSRLATSGPLCASPGRHPQHLMRSSLPACGVVPLGGDPGSRLASI